MIQKAQPETSPIPVPSIRLNKPKRVLLVEPSYKAKYPPLGLMKISTFHKQRGDEVSFFKGTGATIRDQKWDLIYISTLFTYQWKTVVNTIKFYNRAKYTPEIRVGGILASLLAKDLEHETGIEPHVGLWKEVDTLPPDYSLFDGVYDYSVSNASIGYTTRGCIRHCEFCAVPQLEPDFVPYIPLKEQVDPDRKDLLLLDNNVLASPEFPRIVADIKALGFYKEARFKGKLRYVDFNQGVDPRLLTEDRMRLLSEIAVYPLRIAFDDIRMKDLYIERVHLAKKYGIKRLSNFILYNFRDSPEDFYTRLRINVELNETLGLNIYSFPMRYIPLDAKTRGYVDNPHWTRQQLRGVQCILHVTRGLVGTGKAFFEKAFGRDVQEFKYIIEQPQEHIFYRGRMKPYTAPNECAQ
jgi:hypothetical protein